MRTQAKSERGESILRMFTEVSSNYFESHLLGYLVLLSKDFYQTAIRRFPICMAILWNFRNIYDGGFHHV